MQPAGYAGAPAAAAAAPAAKPPQAQHKPNSNYPQQKPATARPPRQNYAQQQAQHARPNYGGPHVPYLAQPQLPKLDIPPLRPPPNAKLLHGTENLPELKKTKPVDEAPMEIVGSRSEAPSAPPYSPFSPTAADATPLEYDNVLDAFSPALMSLSPSPPPADFVRTACPNSPQDNLRVKAMQRPAREPYHALKAKHRRHTVRIVDVQSVGAVE